MTTLLDQETNILHDFGFMVHLQSALCIAIIMYTYSPLL